MRRRRLQAHRRRRLQRWGARLGTPTAFSPTGFPRGRSTPPDSVPSCDFRGPDSRDLVRAPSSRRSLPRRSSGSRTTTAATAWRAGARWRSPSGGGSSLSSRSVCCRGAGAARGDAGRRADRRARALDVRIPPLDPERRGDVRGVQPRRRSIWARSSSWCSSRGARTSVASRTGSPWRLRELPQSR